MIKITDENREEIIEKCLTDAANTLNTSYDEVLEEVSRANSINDASSYIDTMEKHIFMLFVIRNNEYVRHWTGELSNNAYNMISKLDRNRLLSENILNQVFNIKDLNKFKTKLSVYVKYAKNNENYIVNPHTLNIEKLYGFYTEICKWLINQMSHLTIDPNHPSNIQSTKKIMQNQKKKRFKGDEKYTIKYDNYEFDLTKEKFININHKEVYKFIKKLYTRY